MQQASPPIHLKTAADFFRNEPGFKRIFEGFIRNYQSLGRLGGTVKLEKLTQREKETLGGFFGEDYSKNISLTISVRDFNKAQEKTRFANLDLKELLFAYAGEDILTKAEAEEEYHSIKNIFFAELMDMFPDENCQLWLEYILTNQPGSRGIHNAYNEDATSLKSQLINVLKAISSLPTRVNNTPLEYFRLPVFAHSIANDPHAFDLNTQQGRFLISALGIIRALENNNYQFISNPNSEEVTELLSSFGIIRDDILNFVTCRGIIAYDKNSATPIEWWQKSAEAGTVLNVPLREIIKAEKCSSFDGRKRVFVVENSGVFSEILDRLPNEILPPLICTNGQFKLAALLLFDRLIADGVTIYYSGDYDPEGLLMAQRLENRYPGKVHLWHYTIEDYQKSLSEVVLTESRLNKLKKLDASGLTEIKQLMLKTQKAGYQEKLINDIAKDIVDLQQNK